MTCEKQGNALANSKGNSCRLLLQQYVHSIIWDHFFTARYNSPKDENYLGRTSSDSIAALSRIYSPVRTPIIWSCNSRALVYWPTQFTLLSKTCEPVHCFGYKFLRRRLPTYALPFDPTKNALKSESHDNFMLAVTIQVTVWLVLAKISNVSWTVSLQQ